MMLGPVVACIAMCARGLREDGAGATRASGFFATVPWFIVGFLALAALRAGGAVPQSWVAPTRLASTNLTIVAMAALGLSADLRSVARAGSRVIGAVSLSLLVLIALGIAVIHLLAIR